MLNSSKDGILLQISTWSPIAFFFDGLTFLNLKGGIIVCSPHQVSRSHLNKKNYIFHAYIYMPLL